MSELEQTVAYLQARQAIRDCLATYSRGVDRLDRELLLSVYHSDGLDDHGCVVANRDEFADWVVELHTTHHIATQHILGNHTCEIDGDIAHTETYYLFVGMNKSDGAVTMTGGRYVDRFEKRDGRWAIALRKTTADWMYPPEAAAGPLSWLRAHEVGALQTAPLGSRDRNDPSYERPLTLSDERIAAWRRLLPS